jgi:hypothetical protein
METNGTGIEAVCYAFVHHMAVLADTGFVKSGIPKTFRGVSIFEDLKICVTHFFSAPSM